MYIPNVVLRVSAKHYLLRYDIIIYSHWHLSAKLETRHERTINLRIRKKEIERKKMDTKHELFGLKRSKRVQTLGNSLSCFLLSWNGFSQVY